MLDFHEPSSCYVGTPGVQIVEGAIAAAVPAFFILAAGIGTEQHAAWFESEVELP